MSIPVDLVLLRGLLPDVPLHPGANVMARVLAREGDRGTLVLAGARLAAQLPEGVAEGDVLRLRVTEATSERLVLRVLEQPGGPTAPAGTALQPVPVALPLPGGAIARLLVEEEPPGGAADPATRPRTVTLRYDSPRLGRVDVAVTITADAVGATVSAAPGDPVRAAREGSEALRAALGGAAGRAASVSVRARGETVDLRA